MDVTVEQVLDGIAQCLGMQRAEITTATSAEELPAWDSLAVVEMVFMLQRDYDLDLPLAQANSLRSVEAVLATLRAAGKLA